MKRRECHFIKNATKGLITSISVGVKEGEYAFVETLAREGLVPDYVTIDIAHGHSNAVINMIQHLKNLYQKRSLLLAMLEHQKPFAN